MMNTESTDRRKLNGRYDHHGGHPSHATPCRMRIVTINMTVRMHEELIKCQEEGIVTSISEAVRQALRDFLERLQHPLTLSQKEASK